MRMSTTEHIGYCAWCGVLDHHLVNDLCPVCNAKTLQREKDKKHNALIMYQAAHCLAAYKLFNNVNGLVRAVDSMIERGEVNRKELNDLTSAMHRRTTAARLCN